MTNHRLTIARAAAEHLAQIRELAEVVWRAHYPGIISSEQIEYMLACMYDLEVLAAELRRGTTFFRALAGNTLAGFASVGPDDAQSELVYKLHKLYVHPAHQRAGVGTALMRAVQEHACAFGAAALILNVNKRNQQAIAMYQKHGFQVVDAVVADIGQGFVMDDFLMKKVLDSGDCPTAPAGQNAR